MSPFNVTCVHGERELPSGRTVLSEEPPIEIEVMGQRKAVLEFPHPELEVVLRDKGEEKEIIAPTTTIPVEGAEGKEVVIFHRRLGKQPTLTLTWEPTTEEKVEKAIRKRQVERYFPGTVRLGDAPLASFAFLFELCFRFVPLGIYDKMTGRWGRERQRLYDLWPTQTPL